MRASVSRFTHRTGNKRAGGFGRDSRKGLVTEVAPKRPVVDVSQLVRVQHVYRLERLGTLVTVVGTRVWREEWRDGVSRNKISYASIGLRS